MHGPHIWLALPAAAAAAAARPLVRFLGLTSVWAWTERGGRALHAQLRDRLGCRALALLWREHPRPCVVVACTALPIAAAMLTWILVMDAIADSATGAG